MADIAPLHAPTLPTEPQARLDELRHRMANSSLWNQNRDVWFGEIKQLEHEIAKKAGLLNGSAHLPFDFKPTYTTASSKSTLVLGE